MKTKAFIHFYINQANDTVSLPSFVSSFKDEITLEDATKKIPLNFSKFLPGGSERKISLSIDVFAENYEEARVNFRSLSILSRLLFLLKDSQTGNPRKTAILNVLYQNLIIRPNQNPSGKPSEVGLPCYLTAFSQEIQYESGFYTFENYVFPKLIKVNMTLFPVLKSTGEESPSWLINAEGKVEKQSYDRNWPYAAPAAPPTSTGRNGSATTPSSQSNKPPKSATQAALQAGTDNAAATGNGSGLSSAGSAAKAIEQYAQREGKRAAGTLYADRSSQLQSAEDPHYSLSTQELPNGTVVTREERTQVKSQMEDQVGKQKADEVRAQLTAATGKMSSALQNKQETTVKLYNKASK